MKDLPFAKLASPIKIESVDHFRTEILRIMESGESGVMLRKQGSQYMQPESFLKYNVRRN